MAKRANGEGTICKRANGSWEAKITINGKRRSFYGRTQADVKEKLEKARGDSRSGQFIEPSTMTIGEWMNIWIDTYTLDIKDSTRSEYRQNIDAHIIPKLGNIPLQKLRPDAVQSFVNELFQSGRINKAVESKGTVIKTRSGSWEARYTIGDETGKRIMKRIYAKTEKEVRDKLEAQLKLIKPEKKKEAPAGLSARTVELIHTTLQAALTIAYALNYIPSNPALSKIPGRRPHGIVLPRAEKQEMQILQGDEVTAFMDAVENHTHKALFQILLWTGIRRGECGGITWDCVNFKDHTILIKQQLQRERVKGGQLQLVPVKNDKVRLISPPATVFELLAERKREQAQAQLVAGQLWHKSDLVFTGALGKPLDLDAVYKSFKRLLKANNIPDIRLHDLRHTAVTIMLENGDGAKVVQKELGHHSAGFTLDVYGHVTDKARRDSAERRENYIKSLKSS